MTLRQNSNAHRAESAFCDTDKNVELFQLISPRCIYKV